MRNSSERLRSPLNMVGVIPFRPFDGAFPVVVVVVLTDIVGGSRGKLPLRDTRGLIAATIMSMDGNGSEMVGEFGSWVRSTLCVVCADAVEDDDDELSVNSKRYVDREGARSG